eukprot:TRINITY_DN3547_c1_g1_i1.p1 TRINITY_DN3547_c1_g1~~TRINITY_DN3547_c1_g1_i1.p1  ORF type:complete len:890 (+),score=245.50 TRINITY_DN3547_c1_g1_i1:58-2727(+)
MAASGTASPTPRTARSPVPAAAVDEPDDPSQRVQVAVRIRPYNKADGGVTDAAVSRSPDEAPTIVARAKDGRPRDFAFDYVFDTDADQMSVYDAVGHPFVEDAFNGFNCCIFAYGQTGSGKTYSVLGDQDDGDDTRSRGLLPRLVTDILDECQRRQRADPSLSCVVKVSFLEIYNEKVRDLLATKGISPEDVQSGRVQLKDLKLHQERKSKRFYAKDLKQVGVMNLETVLDLIAEGQKFRQGSATQMNTASSRSHSMFTLSLNQTHDPPSKEVRDKECKFTVVDLAGSEHQAAAGGDTKQQKEAQQINLSLFTLGMCLNQTSSGQGGVLPYRSSNLTKLLADIFGGNSKTLMFATVSPSSRNLSESLSTLQYASRAKLIKHTAKVNMIAKRLELKELKDLINHLTAEQAQEREKFIHQRERNQGQITMLEEARGQLRQEAEMLEKEAVQLELRVRQLEEENARLRSGKVPGLNLSRITSPPPRPQQTSAGGTPREGPRRLVSRRVGTTSAPGTATASHAQGDLTQRAMVQLGDEDDDEEEDDVARDAKLFLVQQELTAKLPMYLGLGSVPGTARGASTYRDTTSSRPSARPTAAAPPAQRTELRSFPGHNSAVYCCSFSPDGNRFVSASRDRTVRIWDVKSGTELHMIRGHNGFTLGCDYSPRGDLVVSASEDRTVRLWEAETGKKVHVLRGHQDKVYSAKFSPSGWEVVSASCDHCVKVWSVTEGRKLVTLRGHTHAVFSCCFSRDGTRVASAGDDKSVRVWRWQTAQEIAVLSGHEGTVWSCAWADDKHVASASMDQRIRLWNVDQQLCVRTMTGHTEPVHHIAFARNGKLLVSASRDRTLKVWDIETGRCTQTLDGHNSTVYDCSIHGDAVLSCSGDELIKIWKLQ